MKQIYNFCLSCCLFITIVFCYIVITKHRLFIQNTDQQKTLEQIITEASMDSGIPPLITEAIIKVESTQFRTDRIRHEPHLLNQFKREPWMNSMEHKTLSSSWGLMQVIYGYHKDACGLFSYSELLDPETNVKCGLTALRGCLKGNLEQPVDLKHLREALVCYNGKGKNAEIYADKVLKKLLELYVSSAFDSKSNVTLKQK